MHKHKIIANRLAELKAKGVSIVFVKKGPTYHSLHNDTLTLFISSNADVEDLCQCIHALEDQISLDAAGYANPAITDIQSLYNNLIIQDM